MRSDDLATFIGNRGYHFEEEGRDEFVGTKSRRQIRQRMAIRNPAKLVHGPPQSRFGLHQAKPRGFGSLQVHLASMCVKAVAEVAQSRRRRAFAKRDKEGGLERDKENEELGRKERLRGWGSVSP